MPSVPLALLAALWVAGRVLMLAPYGLAAAIVNAAFPVAAGIAIAVPIVRSANRRNYFFAALLVLMGLAVLSFHLSYQGLLALPARLGLQAGLDIVLVMAVMGGRVIPMFTNSVPGTNAQRTLATGGSPSAASCCCWRPISRRRRRPSWAWWPSWPPSHTPSGSGFGSRGARCARRSSGCCTRPTRGS
jgi:hypothetical protein